MRKSNINNLKKFKKSKTSISAIKSQKCLSTIILMTRSGSSSFIKMSVKSPQLSKNIQASSLRTIQRWIKDTEDNINILERQEGSGRSPSISENIKSKIARTTRRKPSGSSTRKLAQSV